MARYVVSGSRPHDQLLQLYWARNGDKMTLLVLQSKRNGQVHALEDRYKTGLRGIFQKKSNILSVCETSLEMLSCAMTRSLGYNGHKEITFSS